MGRPPPRRLCAEPRVAPSARTRPGPRAPWAPLARLWKPSSEGERPTLRYLEKLEFFCSLKERKTVLFPSELPEVLCCATRGQTANEISGPSLPEPGIRGSVEGSAPRIQPARTLGMLPTVSTTDGRWGRNRLLESSSS